MCQAFSAIVTKSGRVYWQAGMDSHDELCTKFDLEKLDNTTDPSEMRFARVEITPDNGYLYPDGNWTLKIDERIKPTWWMKRHEEAAYKAHLKWKAEVYRFNLEEARNPIKPLKGRAKKPEQIDIENLEKWASVRASVWASVRASVWYSVGDSVWYSVGDSVGAYIGSLFPDIKKWKHIDHPEGEYPFQPVVDLWKRGFVASYDGKTWRLHSGKSAKVVYEWNGQ